MQKALSAPLTAVSPGGTQGSEERGRDGRREATLEGVRALFVLAPLQSSTAFPAFSLHPQRNFPLNLSVLSLQSSR